MAKTAAITLSPSTITAGQVGNGKVVVTNADTDPIEVTGLTIFTAKATDAIKFTHQLLPSAGPGAGPSPTAPQTPLGTGNSGPCPVGKTVVNGSSATITFPFQFVSFYPQGVNVQKTYSIKCQIELSDGTYILATAATLTINSPQGTAYDSSP